MQLVRLLVVLALAVLAAGCGVITGIYKVGFWSGVIVIGLLLVIVFWIAGKFRRR